MSERTYPYTAWTLKPSFKPYEVTIVEAYRWSGGGSWEITASEKAVPLSDLFPTKQAAIDAGWDRIHAQEAKVSKMLDSLNKKRVALVKATEA
jgi:hypothetical protein